MEHIKRHWHDGWHHGHLVDKVHHEAIYDYTHRLNDEYDTLPLPWIEYFIVRINNLIRHNMRWRNTFNIQYDKDTQKITITGFPTHTIKRHFKIGITQTDYTLHKMDYQQAIIYMYGKDHVKLEFLNTPKPDDEPCVKVVHLQRNDLDDLADEQTNCNVLTEPFQCYSCTCCKCQKTMEENNNGQSAGDTTGTDNTNNEPTDNTGDTTSTDTDPYIPNP